MTVIYVTRNIQKSVEWISSGRCMWCGSEREKSYPKMFECFCRRCDKCTRVFLAGERRMLLDGTPPKETCPECLSH